MNSITRLISSLILALGLYFGANLLAQSIYHFKDFDRFVEVKGLAEKEVKSDLGVWEINYSVTGDNLQDLYQQMSKQQGTISTFLTEQGFKTSELSAKNANVIDNWNNQYGQSNDKLPHYQLSAGILVSSQQVDLIQTSNDKINQLIDQGIALSYNNINYFFNGLNNIKTEMLNEATQNAKLSAEIFAKNSESQLSGIKYANQGVFSIDGIESNSLNKKVRVVVTVQYFLQ